MLEGIQEAIDYYFPEDFSFYQSRALSFLKETAKESLPCYLLTKTIISLAKILLADEEDFDFVTKSNTEELAEEMFYARCSFTKEFPEEEKESTKKAFQNFYKGYLERRLDQIELLAKKMQVKSISFAIDFDSYNFYTAVGDPYLRNDPVIVLGMLNPNKLEIKSPVKEIPDTPEIQKIPDFIIAYQLAHIQQCDFSLQLLAKTIVSVVNIYLWFSPYGLLSRVFFMLSAQSVFKVFEIWTRRFQEARADKIAMDTLKTNEGAILFFSSMQNNPRDLTHPKISDRLLAAKNWKAS